jgi:histidine triad (HIT) family protein
MTTEADCLFCRIASGEIPAMRVYEDEETLAFMDVNPSTKGHLLVIPRKHAADLHEIAPDQLAACARTAQKLAGWVVERLDADGVNLLNSAGRAANQTIFHFHLHVIPRYEGDGLRDPLGQRSANRDEIEQAAQALRA